MKTEEKAKAYDRAKEKIVLRFGSNVAEEIFSEFDESEDEKIISAIRKAIEAKVENLGNGVTRTACLAWLEKQGTKTTDCSQNHQDSNHPNGCIVLEDFNGGEGFYKVHLDYLSKKQVEEVEEMVGVWNHEESTTSNENANIQQKDFTPKVESKFNEGDWVIDKQGIVYQVANVVENVTNHTYGYDIVGGGYFNDNIEGVRLWNISDAKDGDVLALSWLEDKNLWEKIVIFKKYHSEGVKGLYSMPCVEGYGKTFKNGKMAFTDEEVPYYSKTWTCNLHPATKEQYDFLFRKIKEAGYEWDAEKKELKKIRQKPTWSEEDESNFQMIIDVIKENKHHATDYEHMIYYKLLSWFKSLKDRYVWKPNDEQMATLEYYMHALVATKHKEVLFGLYQDLKKLMEE